MAARQDGMKKRSRSSNDDDNNNNIINNNNNSTTTSKAVEGCESIFKRDVMKIGVPSFERATTTTTIWTR